jgi:hypothetical protein
LSSFLLKPKARRVKRRSCVLKLRLVRSIWLVLMRSNSGLPCIRIMLDCLGIQRATQGNQTIGCSKPVLSARLMKDMKMVLKGGYDGPSY